MSDLVRWLDARRPPAPPSLRAAMLEAVAALDADPAEADRPASPESGARPVSGRLATAGLRALERVATLPSTRANALDILAADALLTYACEAALEEEGDADGIDPVDRVLASLDLAAFAAIMTVERDR